MLCSSWSLYLCILYTSVSGARVRNMEQTRNMDHAPDNVLLEMRTNESDVERMLLTGSSKGPYRLGRKLGSGAYGTVFLAEHASTRRQVVVKQIWFTPQGRESWNNEHRIWQHMSKCSGFPHANVIEVIDVFKPSSSQGFVVMELAGGGTLADKLYDGISAETTLSSTRTTYGTLMLTNEDAARTLFSGIASGVEWLAQCGVIHKDLKPDNIMFTSDGSMTKIVDLGLAALMTDNFNSGDANIIYNMQQTIVPGVSQNLAVRFDSFALGLILAELGTGVPPYFNPTFDYFSSKHGSLQNEKGLLYITETKQNCAKGAAGLWQSMRRIAPTGGNSKELRNSVREVAGRQFFYLEKGTHYPYVSGPPIGVAIPEQYGQRSWLVQSKDAMKLLAALLAKSINSRVDLRLLSSSAWLAATSESRINTTPTAVKPHSPAPAMMTSILPPENQNVTESIQGTVGACAKTPVKMGHRSKHVCRLSNPTHARCLATVTCDGTKKKTVELEEGFGLTSVRGCYQCEPSLYIAAESSPGIATAPQNVPQESKTPSERRHASPERLQVHEEIPAMMTSTLPPENQDVMESRQGTVGACAKTPVKMGHRSKHVCRLSNPTHARCLATVTCDRTEKKTVEMEEGFGLTSVRSCYQCEPSLYIPQQSKTPSERPHASPERLQGRDKVPTTAESNAPTKAQKVVKVTRWRKYPVDQKISRWRNGKADAWWQQQQQKQKQRWQRPRLQRKGSQQQQHLTPMVNSSKRIVRACEKSPVKSPHHSRNVCRLSNPTRERCLALVTCDGKNTRTVEMEEGFPLTTVRGCYDCKPSLYILG